MKTLLHCNVVLLSVAIGASAAEPRVYWAEADSDCHMFGTNLSSASLDGSDVVLLRDTALTIRSLALHPIEGRTYWIEGSSILRSEAGGVPEIVLSDGSPQDIAIDTTNGRMYWHDFNRIRRANLDGSNVENVVNGLPGGGHIALDVAGGKMYFTVGNASPRRLDRANLDGSGVETVATVASPGSFDGLALDLVNGKVYWTSLFEGRIRKADLDGMNPMDVIIGTQPTAIAIDAANGMFYWNNRTTNTIDRASLDGTGNQAISGTLSPLIDITVGRLEACEKADMNCDGIVDGNDVQAFVQTLLNS